MKNSKLSRLTKLLLTKKAKYIACIIFCVSIGYLLAVFIHPAFITPIPSISKARPTPTLPRHDEEKPSYIVDIPAEYFDSERKMEFDDVVLLDGINVVYPPVAIETPTDIERIDREFDFTDKRLQQASGGPPENWIDVDNDGIKEHNFEYGESTDVNNDGEEEKILYAWTASNHPPHKVYVIKNGRIIYGSEGRGLTNIVLLESKSHNGFYIREAITAVPLYGVGGYKITRFIHENGKFIPVWYQETFNLQTTRF